MQSKTTENNTVKHDVMLISAKCVHLSAYYMLHSCRRALRLLQYSMPAFITINSKNSVTDGKAHGYFNNQRTTDIRSAAYIRLAVEGKSHCYFNNQGTA